MFFVASKRNSRAKSFTVISVSLMVLAKATWSPAFGAERLNDDDIAAWADRTFTDAVEANQISGAVISIVKDGEVVFSNGYGLGDVETGTVADPAHTRVRIGSISKTFTATVIGQLIEEGRIGSVDDPANIYLTRYQLPDNDGIVITLRHLLTHTAGFEDRFFFIGAREPVQLPATPQVIESLRPAYVRPAGKQVVYSNFGVAVLGYLIEDITGQDMEQSIRTQLFEPLGMTSTELAVDVSEPEGLAKPGLIDHLGIVGPTPFTAINPAIAQAGSVVSTAADMARYMNAHLGHSAYLGVELPARMRSPLAGNAAGLTEIGMVFFLDQWAGRTTVSHGGNWAGFHTWMTLIPEDDVGMFVSLLSEPMPNSLIDRFVAAAFPERAKPRSPPMQSALEISNQFLVELLGPKREIVRNNPLNSAETEKFAGLYRADRRPFNTTEAISSLVYFGADVTEITVRDDGLYLGAAGPWISAGDNRFVLDVPTRPMIAIIPGQDGAEPILVPDIGIYTFTRIPAWSDPRVQAIAIHLLLPLTLLGLVAVLWLKQSIAAVAPLTVGISGLAMIACATLGLGAGESLMTGYNVGNTQRMLLFVVFANTQCFGGLASSVAGWSGRLGRTQRILTLTVGVLAIVIAIILAQHNIIGVHRL